MNEYCVLPEQTASYSFCLNDDIIMEGVSVITDTKSCIYDKNKVVENRVDNPRFIIQIRKKRTKIYQCPNKPKFFRT